jgi:3-oxoisoapionate kinase
MKPLVAFYGDDFTGSSDALLVFTLGGLNTVLFLTPPNAQMLARFPQMACIGVAGMSRTQSPEWMDHVLPEIFAQLKATGAPLLYYKVCSTFDSAPAIGSIGRAIDIGTRLMPGDWSPMIVGAPALKRYQAFGNLFAAANGVGYRLDRHPTMSRHPVTPMHEADLRLHLSAQTSKRIELIDLMQLQAGQEHEALQAMRAPDAPVVLIDVIDQSTLQAAGRLVWENRGEGVFTASSSGLPAALVAHWGEQGALEKATPLAPLVPVDVIAVVSGSCSPITAAQIAWASKSTSSKFCVLRLDIASALNLNLAHAEVARLVDASLAAANAGLSPLVYSAAGPEDQAVTGFDLLAAAANMSRRDAATAVGKALAEVMCELLDRSEIRRCVVAGGDSSGEVASALGIDALTIASELEPGAPLCKAWSQNPKRDGLEIVLKGGQMGSPEFFGRVRGTLE